MLAVARHGFARPVGGSCKMNETYIRLADAGGTSKRGCNATLHDGEIDLRQVNGRLDIPRVFNEYGFLDHTGLQGRFAAAESEK
jgi:hypothetical protein